MERLRLGTIMGAALVLVAGCGSPTSYVDAYSEVKLSADTYRISISANAYTNEEDGYRMALLRASELTLASGFERFEIVGGRGVRDRYRGRDADGQPIHMPQGEIVIRMVPASDRAYADAMEARLISNQLKGYRRERRGWFSGLGL
jgi:hypothetical protein